jgi:hypothetical protein
LGHPNRPLRLDYSFGEQLEKEQWSGMADRNGNTGIMEQMSLATAADRIRIRQPRLESYRNMDGGLGVVAYAFDEDRITVRLHNGTTLCFSYASAGRAYVEHMKLLARAGDGLTRFIFKEAKGKHESWVAP